MAAAIIYVLDRDERIREIPEIYNAIHTESLNGESVLEFVSTRRIEKYEHIVLQDADGTWHEFIVSGIDEQHTESGLIYSVFCESSLTELIGDWIDDRRIVNLSATTALERALAGTRWTAGTVVNLGTGTVNFYRESAYSALAKILKTYGGEIETRITVTDGKISAREIDLLSERGSGDGARFEWDRNATEIKREIKRDDVITALHGYGRGEEIGDGFGRRVSFADINGGLSYVANEDARRMYGRMADHASWESLADNNAAWADLAGSWQDVADETPIGRAHRHGSILFDSVTDPVQLKTMTEDALARLSQPAVSYSARVADFAALGLPRVSLGDTVAVIDDDLGIQIKVRVVQIKRDILDPSLDEITLGELTDTIAGSLAKQTEIINGLRSVHGVTRMVSEDGKSWIDYSIPEFVLDGGPNGKLVLSVADILQMFNGAGKFIGGFAEIDGKQGFMAPFLSNTADGSGGVASVGWGTYGGQGIQFEADGRTFMFTVSSAGGTQLYVNNILRQAWWANGATTFHDADGNYRMTLWDSGDTKVLDASQKVRFEITQSGNALIRDHTGKERLKISPDGYYSIRDHNGVERFLIMPDGSLLTLNSAGKRKLIIDNDRLWFFDNNDHWRFMIGTSASEMKSPDLNHALGADNNGPYYVKSGAKTYF